MSKTNARQNTHMQDACIEMALAFLPFELLATQTAGSRQTI